MDRDIFNALMDRAHQNQVNLNRIKDTVQHLDKRDLFTEVYKNLSSLAKVDYFLIQSSESGMTYFSVLLRLEKDLHLQVDINQKFDFRVTELHHRIFIYSYTATEVGQQKMMDFFLHRKLPDSVFDPFFEFILRLQKPLFISSELPLTQALNNHKRVIVFDFPYINDMFKIANYEARQESNEVIFEKCNDAGYVKFDCSRLEDIVTVNVFRNIYEDEKGIHTETFTVPVAGLNDFMPILAESVYNNDAILASCASDLTLTPKR